MVYSRQLEYAIPRVLNMCMFSRFNKNRFNSAQFFVKMRNKWPTISKQRHVTLCFLHKRHLVPGVKSHKFYYHFLSYTTLSLQPRYVPIMSTRSPNSQRLFKSLDFCSLPPCERMLFETENRPNNFSDFPFFIFNNEKIISLLL